MYVVQGEKLRGDGFKRTYADDSLNVAKFEFECLSLVSNYVVLSFEDSGLYEQVEVYFKS